MNFTSQDGDLTNLNWVAGTPVPMNCSVSPKDAHSKASRGTSATSQSVTIRSSTATASSSSSRPRPTLRRGDQGQAHKKPSCSYTCLIAMALKTSSTRTLPVNEIYKYIEREFPFFLTAPDGWKNSIRHNLSLSQSFRKVERTEGWRGKKGYYWEVNPERQATLDREMEKFLRQEGRDLVQNQASDSTPIPAHLQACVPSMPSHPNSLPVHPNAPQTHRTPQVKPVHIDRPESLVTPEQSETWAAFQGSVTPTQYIGINPQTMNSQMVAREVLGPDLCIQECNWPYRPEDNFGYESWYTAYTPTVVGLLEDPSFLSQNSTVVSPYYSPIAGAPPYSFYPTIQGSNTPGSGATPSSLVGSGEWLLQTPVSLQSVEDPTYVDDLIDVNLFDPGPQDELEAEDPLPVISKETGTSTKTNKGKKGAKRALQIMSVPRPRTRAAIKRKAAKSDFSHCSKQWRPDGKVSSDPSSLEASSSNRHDGQASTYRRSLHSKDSRNTRVRYSHANITASEQGPHEEQQSSRTITQDPSMLSTTISSDALVSSIEGVDNDTTSLSAVNLLDSSVDDLNFEVLTGYAAEIVVPATQEQELPQLDLQNDPLLLTA